MTPISTGQQQAIFDDFWNRFSAQIKNNDGQVDFPSESELAPVHATTIVRLPVHIASDYSKLLHEIKTAYPDHYYYPETDMHFTLLNLDTLMPKRSAADIEAATKAIQLAVSQLPPLVANINRIGLFPTTIFAEIYDESGTIEQYRTAIKQAAQTALSIGSTEAQALVKHVAFVNLVRFTHTPDPELVSLVEKIRDPHASTFTVDAFEFVETNKLLSSSRTIVHQKIGC